MKTLLIEPSITTKAEHSLKCYLNDISRIELISPEEEAVLARKMKEGDLAAKARLVQANLRFVVSCAKKYQHLGLPLGDLINEGNIGLLSAAQTFDETKGFRFISYAVWSIRQAMMMALSLNVRLIRLPMNIVRTNTELRLASDKLMQKLEREPTVEEMCEELCLDVDYTFVNYAFGKTVDSFDEEETEQGGRSLLSILPDESLGRSDQIVMEESNLIEIERILSVLTDREKIVLSAFYGLSEVMPRSLDEIGMKLNLSGERVRQLKDQALKKIRGKYLVGG